MIIRSASFIGSSVTLTQCPEPVKPEFAFIGRSNVGKSSLINLLTGYSKLAKTSGNPGKTRTINHFLINQEWFLVDLPGYGYAKVSAGMREKWVKSSEEYILKRENLVCLFVLLDSRHEPQKSDMAFMEFLGINRVPFARVFTKTDKISGTALEKIRRVHDTEMLKVWETLPTTFISSSVDGTGKEEILSFIEVTLKNYSFS
ncbi:MAG TPA: ribosome biogenesis GTP-binding protein YihA/YsxC [Bacteroidales bacterium]|jgi:GTP-binding protein|nr:YihA family ribosome biogenesis GTP-binding protein [Bacteroidales bacterium]MDI9552174.1 ribosome biogenesis GTP-binding protein YihA/YsxC [Bacteroidota bacterium]MBP7037537.1 YihA family ribosome biogenesis GTP-binding protein [Bacteroidales bacterium]MZP66332.1 YihA family ribosome biogenesis GTP-binding protein [Bacteroidales bacterium]NLK54202.1 YihA family ribosome biogenesis GTP-binding protein [Bacteroidales bacterium]